MTITLPDPLRQFVEEQVASGRYESASEYLASLVYREASLEPDEASDDVLSMLGLTQEELDAKLLEGLKSPAHEMTAEDWDALKRRVIERSPELRGQA